MYISIYRLISDDEYPSKERRKRDTQRRRQKYRQSLSQRQRQRGSQTGNVASLAAHSTLLYVSPVGVGGGGQIQTLRKPNRTLRGETNSITNIRKPNWILMGADFVPPNAPVIT